MPTPLPFTFPNESPHEGFPLGNGNFGALIWGRQNRFHATINRQDYWNHRGEIVWGKNASYKKALKVILDTPPSELRGYEPDFIGFKREGMPRPTRMPLGRFDLVSRTKVRDGILDISRGIALLGGETPAFVPPSSDILYVESANFAIEPVPNNSDEVLEYRRKHGIPDPIPFSSDAILGWTQENPGDMAVCAAALKRCDGILVTAVLAKDVGSARELAFESLLGAAPLAKAKKLTEDYFKRWWGRTPHLRISHPRHQILHDYGLFKLAGFTRPGTPAPTLQGPWIEDDRMPPWQSDYHFNINVQMAHWPMLPGNHPEQFEPLVGMLKSWMPRMREYARRFVGIEDGVMLPHGCDDRCCPADANWKCQFDPGSAGWTALVLWDLYRYYGDKDMLGSIGYPMLRGSLRVYQAMMEIGDGASFHAPSPEYIPHGGRAWGKNPSFHLAIIHALAIACIESARILGSSDSAVPGWQRLRRTIPRATLNGDEILVWDGLPLRESHRHHSHLAGIFPFDIFDTDGADRRIVEHTLCQWTRCGTGAWTGWCTPWAAIIWARMRNAHAAFYLLDQYDRFFTGPNYFSSHNAFKRGFSSFLNERPPYIMQMDGTCGALAAIYEMIVSGRREPVLGAAVPAEWGELEFDGIRVPGGNCASGRLRNGKLKSSIRHSD